MALPTRAQPEGNLVLTGVAASPGVVMGPVLVYMPDEWVVVERTIEPDEVDRELERFRTAVEKARNALEEIRERLGVLEEETSGTFIFQAHASLLDDPLFLRRVSEEIRENRRSAESAVAAFAEQVTQAFLALDDRYFQEKAADVRDVMRHVLYNLQSSPLVATLTDRLKASEPCIVVASTLLPSDTLLLPKERVQGFAMETGSRLSHVAILANSLEIPAVVGLGAVLPHVQTGDLAILDGSEGTLIIRPTPEQIAAFRRKRREIEAYERQLQRFVHEPAVTIDGVTVRLLANIELPDEIGVCERYGADGVGLYRTEYGYLRRDELPTEDELYEDYRTILEHHAPMPVILRTLDLGGDKLVPFLAESEAFEGIERYRAIRLCLRHPDFWMPQLRAIWRAALVGNAALLLPMIPGLSELRAAKELIEEARKELLAEGQTCAERLPIGIMIELPSAVLVADLLARECDFFSIGTNDLIPLSLGLDRTHMDRTMASEPYHPGILRALRRVVEEANRAGIPVSVCGEMAGDPFFTLVLLGLGVRELSMHAAAIPVIKRIIRSTTVAEAKTLVHNLMNMPTSQAIDYEVHRYMLDRYGHLFAFGGIRPTE